MLINFVEQTVIDGFDPDKFRKVNTKVGTAASSSYQDSQLTVDRKYFSQSHFTRDTGLEREEMPGVPTYDKGERQLLAALEQELGVL